MANAAEDLAPPGVSFETVTLGDLRLHVATAGPAGGPPAILLHGFPEFWFGWREAIGPLAAAGYRVIAPDQRGYNLSGKPRGVSAYGLDALAGDVLALADRYGAERFSLVGHDWGASVAWHVASQHPERLARLAILNAPHPAIWRRAMREDPVQNAKSRYVQALRIPALPQLLIRAGSYAGLENAFESAAHRMTPKALAAYRTAWERPGALTAMINWYRALFLQDLLIPAPKSLATPTLILWGDNDAFADPGLAEQSAALCADARVKHFPGAGHWIVHDETAAVIEALVGFLGEA